jgi:hypothetical protein
MSTKAIEELVTAINQRAREIYDGDGDDAAERADAKDLVRAFARMVGGCSLRAAFGSPGDWGYNTPIGKALAKVYSEPLTGIGEPNAS